MDLLNFFKRKKITKSKRSDVDSIPKEVVRARHENLQATLAVDEEALLRKLDFSQEVALAIKNETHNPVVELHELQLGDEYDHDPQVRGIKSVLDSRVNHPAMLNIVRRLQSISEFQEFHVFSGGHYGSDEDYFIGSIKTRDQYECLRVFETNGINYNLTTEDIINFLEKWKGQVDFSILDAYHDRVIIQLANLEFDLDKFAKECLEFCPDFRAAVEDEDQLKGYIIDRKGELDFWWD